MFVTSHKGGTPATAVFDYQNFLATPGPGVTVAGAGTVTLSGSDNYYGTTTINAGALLVDGALTASPVAVNAGGTLEGVGPIADTVTLASGGAILPGPTGANSTGSLSTGSLSLQAGASYDVELAGASPGQYDQLNVTGTATLSGATLNVSYLNKFSPTLGQTFTIIQTTGGVSGQFAQGTTITVGNATYTISYTANGGDDVVLTDVTPTATTTTVSTSHASVVYGTRVTFTATVTNTSGTEAPTGSVALVDETTGDTLATESAASSTTSTTSTWTFAPAPRN